MRTHRDDLRVAAVLLLGTGIGGAVSTVMMMKKGEWFVWLVVGSSFPILRQRAENRHTNNESKRSIFGFWLDDESLWGKSVFVFVATNSGKRQTECQSVVSFGYGHS